MTKNMVFFWWFISLLATSINMLQEWEEEETPVATVWVGWLEDKEFLDSKALGMNRNSRHIWHDQVPPSLFPGGPVHQESLGLPLLG